MNPRKNPADDQEDYQELSQAITEALLNSEEVQSALVKLQRKRKVKAKGLLILALSLEDLKTAYGPTSRKKVRPIMARIQDQFIDGRRLSAKEIAFHEFLVEKFNERKWLRQNRLSLDNPFRKD